MTDLIDIYRAAKLVSTETAKTLSFTQLQGRWFSLARATKRVQPSGARLQRQSRSYNGCDGRTSR